MSVKTIAASLRSVESSGISEEESVQTNVMLAPELFHASPRVWGNRRVHDKRRLSERYGRNSINLVLDRYNGPTERQNGTERF